MQNTTELFPACKSIQDQLVPLRRLLLRQQATTLWFPKHQPSPRLALGWLKYCMLRFCSATWCVITRLQRRKIIATKTFFRCIIMEENLNKEFENCLFLIWSFNCTVYELFVNLLISNKTSQHIWSLRFGGNKQFCYMLLQKKLAVIKMLKLHKN